MAEKRCRNAAVGTKLYSSGDHIVSLWKRLHDDNLSVIIYIIKLLFVILFAWFREQLVDPANME